MQMLTRRVLPVVLLWTLAAAQAAPGILGAEEVKKLVPVTYFFAGQSAPVQVRNSAVLRTAKGKLVLAGMVDTSGYAADVAARYQGFFITETKLSIGGHSLAPGQYGFGFSQGKFRILDVAAGDLITVDARSDAALHRPVPLQMTRDGDATRLYAGRNWVSFKAE